jgi:hypothetical protein
VANQVHAFKDRDVQRVIKAARSAGLQPSAVEVDPRTGKIKVMSGTSTEHDAAPNERDRVYDDGAASTAIHK